MPIALSGTNGITFPTWTTATRPASPATGQTGFNTTTGQLEAYDGTNWEIYTGATTQGTSGQFLKSNGSGVAPSWASAGLATAAVQTGNFTAVAGNIYPVNTTSGAITVSLPASPSAGNFVTIVDYAGTASTNNITISPNGSKINASTANTVINSARNAYNFVYVDSTQGWISYADQTLNPYNVEFLIVAGGGGAASKRCGGGGAGGYISSNNYVSSGTIYTITVGGGGAGNTSFGSGPGGAGSNSSVSLTLYATAAVGGGGGGTYNSAAGSGGSGGGAGSSDGNNGTAGSATSGQGSAGGSAGTGFGGAGGGGASAVGSNVVGTSNGANGGAGTAWSDGVTYAGGGGGGAGSTSGTGGTGGAGGGGNGGNSGAGTAGTANRGGGAGGTGDAAGATGASGGSGIVIIRYGGSQRGSGGTVTSAGGYTYHTFTTSGTFTA